jgi:ATP synthase protein I
VTVRREVGVRALLGTSVLVALGVAVLCMVLGAVVAGTEGLAAAALGGVLVVGFLLLGQLPLVQVAKGRRGVGALMLLLGYLLQVLVLLVVFAVVVETSGVDEKVLGLTIIAVALGWTGATVWRWLRWRPPVVEVDLPSDRGSAPR